MCILRMDNASVPVTDLFTCGVCEQTCTNLTEFLSHKLQHNGPGNSYVCQLCQISYTKLAKLKQHYKDKHRVPLDLRRKNVSKNNKYMSIPTDLQKVDNSSCLEVITVDHLNEMKVSENTINATNFFSNDVEISHNNHDNDYDDEGDETVMIDNDNHDQVSNQKSSDIGDGFFQLKSLSTSQLSYSDEVIFKDCDRVLDQEAIIQVSSGTLAGGNDGVPAVCNVEIINIDEPVATLNIDENAEEKDDNDIDFDDEHYQKDFYFFVRAELNSGKNLVYKRQDLCCIYCSFQDMVLANLYQHMCDNHDNDMNTNVEFKLQDGSNDIKLMKFSEYKKQCSKYKPEITNERCRNTETQDQAGEFLCTMCNKLFTRLRYLKQHLRLHKLGKPYLCDDCGKSFKTQSYLTIHKKSHETKSFECDQCNFKTDNPSLKQLHRQQHNKGSVLCDICGNAYCDKSTLTKHKRVHDPNRPYQCDYPGCTWRFMTEVMCRAHQRNHNTEGKFKCSICGYAFRHKHHVKRHEAQVHGIKVQAPKTENVENEAVTPINNIISRITGGVSQNVLNMIKSPQGEETNSLKVKVLVETNEDHGCLSNAINGGQLVITTESELNYQQIEISNVTLIDSQGGHPDLILPILQDVPSSVETTMKDNDV